MVHIAYFSSILWGKPWKLFSGKQANVRFPGGGCNWNWVKLKNLTCRFIHIKLFLQEWDVSLGDWAFSALMSKNTKGAPLRRATISSQGEVNSEGPVCVYIDSVYFHVPDCYRLRISTTFTILSSRFVSIFPNWKCCFIALIDVWSSF